MNPSDLSLPSKFTDFRPGQEDAILDALSSDKRFQLISAPTGIGKSLIYMAMARIIAPQRTLILTGTKGLQQQLMSDFHSIGLHDVRGQSNYRCIAFDPGSQFDSMGHPGETCDKGPCHLGIQCGFRRAGCLYYDTVAKASQAQTIVTNYSYWMTINRYSDPDSLGRFDLLVLDEAHTAPDELNDFCTIELHAAEVRRVLDMDLPPIDEGQDIWAEWAVEARDKGRALYKRVYAELQELGADRRHLARQLRTIADVGRRVGELAKTHHWKRSDPAIPDVAIPGMQTDWIAEKTDEGLRFSPVWSHAYAEECIFRGIPKVTLLSATLQEATARYLGIKKSDYDYREFASTFNPARRPLIYLPTTTVDRNMTEGQYRVWINKIDKIIEPRANQTAVLRKGIIHPRSYDRAHAIFGRSKCQNLMLTHTSRETRDTVEKFKRSIKPVCLVSPAVDTGWDFPDDQCRYQIIAKVPFVDSRSPVIKARAKSDKTYLNYLTAQALIQMVGRGMRSADDWCETFIIDDHISWFWQAAKKQGLLPKWFQAAFKKMTVVPPPLEPKFGGIRRKAG